MKTARLSLSLITLTCALIATSEGQADACGQPGHHSRVPTVDNYKITILSDSIPGRNTTSEWGFSALVEISSGGISKRFLFDTGNNAGTVLSNANALGINLCDIEDVVVSHSHADHIGGLENLRKTCAKTNPNAFVRAHVGGPEIFWPRIGSDGKQKNPMVKMQPLYEAQNGQFVVNERPHEFLLPGVYLTGKISRTYDEKTYEPVTPMQIQDPSGQLGPELVPEDQALVINTANGVVVLTGCAHAGAINTIEQAVRMVGGGRPTVTLAGGLHWYEMEQGDVRTVGTLDWEALKMAELNVTTMLGGHCTGVERFLYMREFVGLDRTHTALSAIGTVMSTAPIFSFTLPQATNAPIEVARHHGGHGRR